MVARLTSPLAIAPATNEAGIPRIMRICVTRELVGVVRGSAFRIEARQRFLMFTTQPALHPEGKDPSVEMLLHLAVGIIDPRMHVVHFL